MKKRILLSLLVLFLAFEASSQSRRPGFPFTNGMVYALKSVGDSLFVGGVFTRVFHDDSSSRYGATITKGRATLSSTWAKPNAKVTAVISDGNKGFYVGGDFTRIGDSIRYGLAHLDSIGAVTPVLAGTGVNGTINTMALRDDTLYIGGVFNRAGRMIKSGCAVLDSSSKAFPGLPEVYGAVSAAVADGNGGWYIGGSFTSIGNSPQERLAHLDSTGNLLPFISLDNGAVSSLVLQDNKLYVGGTFTSIAAYERKNLAAIDLSTGTVTAWDPGANNSIYALKYADGVLYAGGSFTKMGDSARRYIAAIDTMATGNITVWNPDANNSVYALEIVGEKIYTAGAFDSISGFNRKYIACIDKTTGIASAWNPSAGYYVYALAFDGGKLFAGGNFFSIGGQPRYPLAQLDTATGLATSWKITTPSANIQTLLVKDSTLYVGGYFQSIQGSARYSAVALSIDTAVVKGWEPNVMSSVYTICISGNQTLVGGSYGSVGGENRLNLAAIDVHTALPTPLNPKPNQLVSALEFSDTMLLVGGYFQTIGGQSRNNLAAVNPVTGIVDSWNPKPDGWVYCIEASDTTIYFGGDFNRLGLTYRRHIAAVSRISGVPLNFNPNLNSTVYDIEKVNDLVYVAGSFTNSTWPEENNLASYHAQSGALMPWDANMCCPVKTIAVDDTTVYAGGDIRIEAISTNTGARTAWDPATNLVSAIALSDKHIYAGGSFVQVCGFYRRSLACINTRTSKVSSWNTPVDETVYAMEAKDNMLYVGGDFNNVGNQPRKGIAGINMLTGQTAPLSVDADGIVRVLMVKGDTLYAGGSFTSVASQTRNRLASINISTGTLNAWNPDVDNTVWALNLDDTTLYAGGEFTHIGGQLHNYIAAISTNTGHSSNWNPAVNNVVISLARADTTLYMAGGFTTVGGQNRRMLAAVSTPSAIPTPLNLNITSSVWCIALLGDELYVGGSYPGIGGKNISGLAVANRRTGVVADWKTDLVVDLGLRNVRAMEIDSTTLYAGGDFSYPNGAFLAALELNRHFNASVPQSSYCAGDSMPVTFEFSPKANLGNTFTFELSDASGKYSDEVLGSMSSTYGGMVNVMIPADAAAGENYLLRIKSSNPAMISEIPLSVKAKPVADFTVNDPAQCLEGNSFTFTDTSAIISGSLSYNWDFGDGDTASGNTVTRVCSFAGNYTVKLVIVSDMGCTDSIMKDIEVYAHPEVNLVPADTVICQGMITTIKVWSDTGISYQWFYNDMPLGITADSLQTDSAGAYKVIVANTHQCTDTSAVTQVLVYPRPEVSIAPGDTAICSGNTVVFRAIPDTGLVYQWLQNDIPTGLVTDTLLTGFPASYRVMGISPEGCADTSTASVVTNNPVPSTGSITGNINVTEGDMETYSVATTTGSVYEWIFTNGTGSSSTNSINITWTTEGNTTLKVVETNSYGCSGDTSRLDIAISAVLSVPGISPGTLLKAYPNPTQDKVYIETTDINRPSVKVYNALGQLVAAEITVVKPGLFIVSLSAYDNGIYTIVLTGAEGKQALGRITLSR